VIDLQLVQSVPHFMLHNIWERLYLPKGWMGHALLAGVNQMGNVDPASLWSLARGWNTILLKDCQLFGVFMMVAESINMSQNLTHTLDLQSA